MEVKKQSKIKLLLPYFLFTIVLFLVVLNYVGDYNGSRDQDHEEVELEGYALSDWVKEWVNWKLDNEVHTVIQELNSTTLRIYQDKDQNREAIAELRLFVIKEMREPEAVPPPAPTSIPKFTPLVTLTISKIEWGLGQTIIFSGSGTPGETAILNVIKAGGCGQKDVCSDWQKIDNNGSFRIEFPIMFDETPGVWSAYVRVGDLRSDTITFEVI